MKIPLAWRNLIHHKRRLALSLAGIGFVVLLMFMETGFLHGALDTQLVLYEALDADLVISSAARTPDYPRRFDRSRLVQARASPFVEAVVPVYLASTASWKVPTTGDVRTIRAVGFDARRSALIGPPPGQETLRTPGNVLFDSKARDVFGRPRAGSVVELNGRAVTVSGLFSLGVDLETDGTLLMDEATYFAVFGENHRDDNATAVDLGLVQLRPGVDPRAALADLRGRLAADVHVDLRPDFLASIKSFWSTNTPMGFLFQTGVFVGFLIGVIVCYQILFSDISANLMPFATLKGMGYHDSYLVKVVLEQAAILSVLGFACGLAGAVLLYRFLHWGTGLVMVLTFGRAATTLAWTTVMCMTAGVVAVGKVLKADPADCF